MGRTLSAYLLTIDCKRSPKTGHDGALADNALPVGAAQKNLALNYLDLLFFVSPATASDAWITNKFSLPIPYSGATCQQSLITSPNSQAYVAVNSTAAAPVSIASPFQEPQS